MRLTLIVFLGLLLFASILTYPIKFKSALHINFLEDVGFGAIKLVGVKLFCARFRLTRDGRLEVNNAVKKKKKKKDKTVTKNYFLCLAKLSKLKKFEIIFDGGVKEDAYASSMMCGYVSALSESAAAAMIEGQPHVKIFTRINPHFNEDCIQLSGSIVLSFCLLDMLLSIFCAYMCLIKKKIKEKQNA